METSHFHISDGGRGIRTLLLHPCHSQWSLSLTLFPLFYLFWTATLWIISFSLPYFCQLIVSRSFQLTFFYSSIPAPVLYRNSQDPALLIPYPFALSPFSTTTYLVKKLLLNFNRTLCYFSETFDSFCRPSSLLASPFLSIKDLTIFFFQERINKIWYCPFHLLLDLSSVLQHPTNTFFLLHSPRQNCLLPVFLLL